MRPRVPIAAACVVLAASGCSGGGSPTTAAPVATTAATTPSSPPGRATSLEALLPDRVGGKKLAKRSATGTSVLAGGDAFSARLTKFLASHGKEPADLRFANAHDTARKLDLELGVFQASGVAADALLRAIVAASRPGAPGLVSSTATISGKRVTRLLYPSGSTLYLYARGQDVYYVGTQSEALAREVLVLYP